MAMWRIDVEKEGMTKAMLKVDMEKVGVMKITWKLDVGKEMSTVRLGLTMVKERKVVEKTSAVWLSWCNTKRNAGIWES